MIWVRYLHPNTKQTNGINPSFLNYWNDWETYEWSHSLAKLWTQDKIISVSMRHRQARDQDINIWDQDQGSNPQDQRQNSKNTV